MLSYQKNQENNNYLEFYIWLEIHLALKINIETYFQYYV